MEDQKHTPFFKKEITSLPWRLEKSGLENPSCEVYPIEANDYKQRIAEFLGPNCEANAQLFMDAPGMKAESKALKAALAKIADLENETRVHFDPADAGQLWDTLHSALLIARTTLAKTESR